MSYLVTITKNGRLVARFTAIGNRNALMDAAYDEHDVCGVTIMVQP
jgi:antitoxin (DNA-binding transcriptional repressor) of toxin-antitoxin stability system